MQDKWPSDEVLLTRYNPPAIFEINLSDIVNPLYKTSYGVFGEDYSYTGTSLIAANEQFLVTMMRNVEAEHPVLFFYDR